MKTCENSFFQQALAYKNPKIRFIFPSTPHFDTPFRLTATRAIPMATAEVPQVPQVPGRSPMVRILPQSNHLVPKKHDFLGL